MADLEQTEDATELQTQEVAPADESQVLEAVSDLTTIESSLGSTVVSTEDSVNIGKWSEVTALSFLGLMDIADGNVRRTALNGMGEEDLAILILIAQSYVNLQFYYSVENKSDATSVAAKANQDKLNSLKSWIGI
jgi:hypothetical protein